MVRDLTCKEFNIETEVDPHFIHAVRLGWTGFYNITFAQLQRDLIEAQRFLKKQQEYQLLETRCKDLKAANVPITNIVVLGNGSIEEYSSKYSQARTESRIEGIMQGPMGQLAAAMEISRLLGGTSRRPGLRKYRNIRPLRGLHPVLKLTCSEIGPVKPLPCIFQDPMTSRFEQRFLQSLGHKVVDDPDAFALINANSLVIFIHNPCMEEFIAEGVWPAAILAWASWESPQSWLDYLLQADESDSQIASASNQGFAKLPLFLQAYQQLPFLETRVMTEDGLMCKWVSKYDLHLKKDSDGVDGFSFTV